MSGDSPDSGGVFETLRAEVAKSAFAAGMTRHLDQLPGPALRLYLDQFLPAAVTASGFRPEQLAADLVEMTAEVTRQQLLLNRRGNPGEPFDVAQYENPELMERFYLNGLTGALVFWPNHWAMLRFFEETVAALPLPSSGRCLDVGCGSGVFSARLAAALPSWNVVSLDISSLAVERARRLWRLLKLPEQQQTAVHEDVSAFLDASGDEFDAILFSEIIEHLDDGPAVLARLARRLSPDGVMFFTTALNSYFPDHRLYFHSIDEVRSIIAAAELEILGLEIEPVADTPSGPQADLFALLSRPGSRWSRTPRQGVGLHHVGMLVRDLDRSLLRWTARGAERVLGPVTDLRMDCRVVFLKAPETPALIELVSPFSSESPLGNRMGRNPLDHLCYAVPDLESELAAREAAGGRLVYGPERAAAFRREVAFVLDGDGLLSELVEWDLERPWLV